MEYRYTPENYHWPHLAFKKYGSASCRFAGVDHTQLIDGRFYSPQEIGVFYWLNTIKKNPTPKWEDKCLQFRRFTYEDYTDDAVCEFKHYAKQLEKTYQPPANKAKGDL